MHSLSQPSSRHSVNPSIVVSPRTLNSPSPFHSLSSSSSSLSAALTKKIQHIQHLPAVWKEYKNICNLFVETPQPEIPLPFVHLSSSSLKASLGDEFARPFDMEAFLKEYGIFQNVTPVNITATATHPDPAAISQHNLEKMKEREVEQENAAIKKQRINLLNSADDALWNFLRIMFLLYIIKQYFF